MPHIFLAIKLAWRTFATLGQGLAWGGSRESSPQSAVNMSTWAWHKHDANDRSITLRQKKHETSASFCHDFFTQIPTSSKPGQTVNLREQFVQAKGRASTRSAKFPSMFHLSLVAPMALPQRRIVVVHHSCPTQRPMNFGEHFCIQSCIRNMYDPRIILCKNLSSFSRWCKGIVKSLLPACMHKPQDCQACHKVWKATRFSSCINQKVKALGKDRCGPNQISRYDLWIIAPAEGPCGGFEHPVGASKEWASQVFMSLSTCSVHTKAIFAAFKLKSPWESPPHFVSILCCSKPPLSL